MIQAHRTAQYVLARTKGDGAWAGDADASGAAMLRTIAGRRGVGGPHPACRDSEADHARLMADLNVVLSKYREHEDVLQTRLQASRDLMHTLLGAQAPKAVSAQAGQ